MTGPRSHQRAEPSTGDEATNAADLHSDDPVTKRVRSKHRRTNRNRRFIVAGTVALALIGLVVTFAALRDTDAPEQGTVAQGIFAATDPGDVGVDPSTGLDNGRRVTVSGHGFDIGTTVRFFLCIPAEDAPRILSLDHSASSPEWVCRSIDSNDTSNAAVARQQTDTPNDPQAGLGPTLATTTIEFNAFSPQISELIDHSGKTSHFIATTPAEDIAPVCDPTGERHTERCVIVAIGRIGGKTRVTASQPLQLGSEQPARETVKIEPATKLRSEQKVQVSTIGFDEGTTVKFLECIGAFAAPEVIFTEPSPPPLWVCHAPRNPDADPDAPDEPIVSTVAQRAELAAADHATGSGSTIASATMTVSFDTFSFSRWIYDDGHITDGHPYPGEDPPTPGCGQSTTMTDFEWRRIATVTPCVVVAVGTQLGQPHLVVSQPLTFAS